MTLPQGPSSQRPSPLGDAEAGVPAADALARVLALMRQALAEVSPSPASPELTSLLSSGLVSRSHRSSDPLQPTQPVVQAPRARTLLTAADPVVLDDETEPPLSGPPRSTLAGSLLRDAPFGGGNRLLIGLALAMAIVLGLVTSGSLGILSQRSLEDVAVVNAVGRRAQRIDAGVPGQITVAWAETGEADSLVLLETDLSEGWSVLDDGRDEQKQDDLRVFGLDVLLANGAERVSVVVVLQDGVPVVRRT